MCTCSHCSLLLKTLIVHALGSQFAASSTLKTVANAALACSCILLLAMRFVLFPLQGHRAICTFAALKADKVSTHDLDAGHPVQVQVQHGDVIVIAV